VDVVERWTAAWNARDIDALAALAHPDIEVQTPRATASGIEALRALLAKQTYGVRLFIPPQDLRVRGDRVLATGPVELRWVEDDRVAERMEDAAACFELRDGRIARFTPYPDVAAARRAEGFGA